MSEIFKAHGEKVGAGSPAVRTHLSALDEGELSPFFGGDSRLYVRVVKGNGLLEDGDFQEVDGCRFRTYAPVPKGHKLHKRIPDGFDANTRIDIVRTVPDLTRKDTGGLNWVIRYQVAE